MSLSPLSDSQPLPAARAPLLNRSRMLVGAATALFFIALFNFGWESGFYALAWRTLCIVFSAVFAFALFDRWPRSLPRGLARWVVQVIVVALAIPLCTFSIYVLTTAPGAPDFWMESSRLEGFLMFTVPGILIGPWIALAALVRKKDAIARHQRLEFSLQRSELERQALDARLRLLQAQVAPHFLFNTLANIRELVESGSDRAPAVLNSLIRYLQATIPRLENTQHSIAVEIDSVRAYLELMQMRIPDRLKFRIDVQDQAMTCDCPPTLLLTLVENAVRHGIDPAEEGGRITVIVLRKREQIVARVEDTGTGTKIAMTGNGTGLVALEERLRILYGDSASLRATPTPPSGFVSEVTWPVAETTDE